MNRVRLFLDRNKIDINGEKIQKKELHLEWWKQKENVGDFLSNIVFEWMMRGRLNKTKKTEHILGIGSLLGGWNFDATVWGSGILNYKLVKRVYDKAWYVKYDLRAVRGPLSLQVLMSAGYKCHDVALGDPAILMPMIYTPSFQEKVYKYCIVNHYINNSKHINEADSITISAGTNDYKWFISMLKKAEMVISSSLHGIILAESYGIPAIFLCENMEDSLFKIYDYYYSTGRYSIKIAKTIEEAKELGCMPLPELKEQCQLLMDAFPYDLLVK